MTEGGGGDRTFLEVELVVEPLSLCVVYLKCSLKERIRERKTETDRKPFGVTQNPKKCV